MVQRHFIMYPVLNIYNAANKAFNIRGVNRVKRGEFIMDQLSISLDYIMIWDLIEDAVDPEKYERFRQAMEKNKAFREKALALYERQDNNGLIALVESI